MAISFKSGNIESQGNDQVMVLFKLLRCSVAGKVFELFLRSKEDENKAKGESFILFKINLEEFLRNEDKTLIIILQLYREMIKMVGHRLPKPSRLIKMREANSGKLIEVDDAKEVK